MDIWAMLKLMFRAEVPRHEAVTVVEDKLAEAELANRQATNRNLRAVQRLIDDTLKLVNKGQR